MAQFQASAIEYLYKGEAGGVHMGGGVQRSKEYRGFEVRIL